MKKIIIIILIMVSFALAYKWNYLVGLLSMSREQKEATLAEADKLGSDILNNGQKVLIVYFSWGGNTRKLAHAIQAKIGGDIFEIKTKEQNRYPNDYKSATIVAKKEFAEKNKPELAKKIGNIADYDVIFVGYPIWWHTAPMAIQVFLETHNLEGKKLIPFATSGGEDIKKSLIVFKELAPKSILGEAITANSRIMLNSWLETNGMKLK